jgi:DNA-directed RNA polymerase subunit M/transcription elongation factor TFIIS
MQDSAGVLKFREIGYLKRVSSCPSCGNRAVVTNTLPVTRAELAIVRYHRCVKCGHRYKSCERLRTLLA